MNNHEYSKLHLFSAGDKKLLLDVNNHGLFQLHEEIVIDVISQLIERLARIEEDTPAGFKFAIDETILCLKDKYTRDEIIAVLKTLNSEGILNPETKLVPRRYKPATSSEPLTTIAICDTDYHIKESGWLLSIFDYIKGKHSSDTAIQIIFEGSQALNNWEKIKEVLEKNTGDNQFKFILDVEPNSINDDILKTIQHYQLAIRVILDHFDAGTMDQRLLQLIGQTHGRLALCLKPGRTLSPEAVKSACDSGCKLIYLEDFWREEAILTHEATLRNYLLRLTDVSMIMAACHLGKFRNYGCQAGLSYLAINSDGNIYPCHRFAKNGSFKIGNIKTGISPEFQNQFPQNHVDNKPVCQSCWTRYFCGGGCMYQNWSQNQNIAQPDTAFCERMKHLVRYALGQYLELNEQQKNILDLSLVVATSHKPYLAFNQDLFSGNP